MSATGARLRFEDEAEGGFYETVKARVQEHLSAAGRTRFGDRRVAVKGLFYAACVAGSYAIALSGLLGPWGSLAMAVVYGASVLLLAINLGHDAAHNCLSPSRLVNKVILTVTFTLVGASGYLWQQRHVRSHHVFPNVNGCDIDIDENPLLRLSPNHPRKRMHRFQHLYGPPVYVLVAMHTIFMQDFIYLFKRDLANMRGMRHAGREYVLFVLCKAAYFGIVIGAPMALTAYSWWQIVIAYVVMTGASSLVFVYLLIGTHFCEEAEFPVADAFGMLPRSWAAHALATSADWSPRSRIANFIVGGANAHAAHHLFPNLCHVHYPEITRIIAEVVAEHGVRYNVLTLPRMVVSHFRLLKRLGSGDEDAGRVTAGWSRGPGDPR